MDFNLKKKIFEQLLYAETIKFKFQQITNLMQNRHTIYNEDQFPDAMIDDIENRKRTYLNMFDVKLAHFRKHVKPESSMAKYNNR
ncbi:MAG: hypothetical protein GY874_14515 [Desulfobacteraceae bacterium]|nr:hypothetical protein [Desulfobacteraceae bacterium]